MTDVEMQPSKSALEHLYTLPVVPIPAPLAPASYDEFRSTSTPVIIDNGAVNLRYGFATSPTPFSGTSIISKFKDRRNNRPLMLFGDAVDIDSAARAQMRTPWEGDVLLNFDALENALDYALVHLGLDTPTVEHPVLMTERLASPLHSRALTSELMFELYSVPSLAYCVDSVMSFYQNNTPTSGTPFTSNGLVVSFNSSSTSVIPIMDGKGIMSHAKRIPWGATQSTEYLLKLIQLKYPTFPARVTTHQTNWMLRTFCSFAPDYPALLRTLKDPLNLRAAERIIQFPFTPPVVEEKSEEELARIAERRREQGRKLQELAQKQRLEKLIQKENDLEYLIKLRDGRGKEGKKEWTAKLQNEGFESEAALDETIKKLDTDIKRRRKKDAAAETDDNAEEPPSFPLVDVPDADLDEEGLKEKRKQRLLKAGFEARERAKREKEKEREEREAEERREADDRDRDLAGWATKLRSEQQAIMSRMKERQRRKTALSDRKSAASQARMKNIASLAADDRVPKKRKKGNGEDNFGADDADWLIYRKINMDATSSDEEEDLTTLQTVEAKLLAHDPTFTQDQTHAALTSQRSALLAAWRPQYEDGDVEGNVRIHLATERWRVCEAWFSPGMAGVDVAGLGEVCQMVLSRFSDSEKAKLAKNVFLTGAPSQLPGLKDRLYASLRPVLPPEMPIDILHAADPVLDAWKGMAAFAQTDDFGSVCVTKEEYDEWGGERVRRWWGGNWNYAAP